MANPKWRRQTKNATSAKILEEMKKASEIGWDSLINVCHQIHRDVGEFSFKESFRVYTCYYRRSVISSSDCIKKYGFNSAQQIVPSRECVPLPVGNELNHAELRERCVIELAQYSAYYL